MTNSQSNSNKGAVDLSSKHNDFKFYNANFITPLIFLVMFVIFIYGALFIGLLGIAKWIINAWHIDFFQNLGNAGIVVLVLLLPTCWAMLTAICSYTTYRCLYRRKRYILAEKTAVVIVFAMFHIFALPWILWPMVRRASPKLQSKYRQRLRQMVLDGKTIKRQEERHKTLI